MKKTTTHIFATFLLVASGSSLAGAEEIDGAFGIIFGQTLNSVKTIGRTLLKNGSVMYEFIPDKPHYLFSQYNIMAAPGSNRIYSILAFGNFDMAGKCEREKEKLGKLLMEKYYDNADGDSMLHRPGMFSVDNRYISIACDEAQKTLGIVYTDMNIKN